MNPKLFHFILITTKQVNNNIRLTLIVTYAFLLIITVKCYLKVWHFLLVLLVF